jgi:hypothetical protein
MAKSVRQTFEEWQLRDKTFVMCGSIMALAGLAELTFRPSDGHYKSAWFVVLGVFCLCTGIYNLAKIKRSDE